MGKKELCPVQSDQTIRDSIFNCTSEDLVRLRDEANAEFRRQLTDQNSPLWKALGGFPRTQEEASKFRSPFVFVFYVKATAERVIPELGALKKSTDPLSADASRIMSRFGWWLFPDFSVDFYYDIVENEHQLTQEMITEAVLSYANKDNYTVLTKKIEGWRDPAFTRRYQIFKDALNAHKAGLYTLSVPTLLPHLEGIMREKLGEKLDWVEFQFQNGYTEFSQLIPAISELPTREHTTYSWDEVNAVVNYAPLLAIAKVFSTFRPEHEYNRDELNRHAICHGRWLTYNTSENSTRIFLLLDALHDLMGKAWPIDES